MAIDYEKEALTDASRFVLLSDYVPGIIQEIRYFSTYNFVGERIEGYEEPCALMTRDAARALKAVSNKAAVMGYRLKVFDAYRPARAVRHFVLWGLEDLDQRQDELDEAREQMENPVAAFIAGILSTCSSKDWKSVDTSFITLE